MCVFSRCSSYTIGSLQLLFDEKNGRFVYKGYVLQLTIDSVRLIALLEMFFAGMLMILATQTTPGMCMLSVESLEKLADK